MEGGYAMRKMRDYWQRSEKSKSGRKKIPEIYEGGSKDYEEDIYRYWLKIERFERN